MVIAANAYATAETTIPLRLRFDHGSCVQSNPVLAVPNGSLGRGSGVSPASGQTNYERDGDGRRNRLLKGAGEAGFTSPRSGQCRVLPCYPVTLPPGIVAVKSATHSVWGRGLLGCKPKNFIRIGEK